VNPISNPTNFENTSPFQTVFSRIINPANCFDIAELELQTSNNLLSIPNLEACDGDIKDGFAIFTLSDIGASIVNLIPTNAQVTYYENEDDAISERNALSNTYENITINTQTIFVKVKSNNQCFSISTTNLNVLYTPTLKADETLFYCVNSFPETITIFGEVLDDLSNNYYYEWFFNGTLTNTNTLFKDINETGIYTVIVTDPNGCSSSRTITVNPSETATIESVIVEGIERSNTITINVSGNGSYEYAIDDSNGVYQDSNVFTNILRGFHTVYVRDKNSCGISEEIFSVLGFPKFFTPNGDGNNDTWSVIGSDEKNNLIEQVQIFNRYGKLIKEQNTMSGGWDGSLNGNELPSDDYWFIITFADGKTYTGHFALKR
jgi:gliding motility-associated-like protein